MKLTVCEQILVFGGAMLVCLLVWDVVERFVFRRQGRARRSESSNPSEPPEAKEPHRSAWDEMSDDDRERFLLR